MSRSWQPTIGLEVHVQLATRSKLFSGAPVDFGAEANTCVSEVDLALPGTLPVLNEAAVRMAVMFGLAVDATIAPRCVFARKNYFYPDLPRGYQISQYSEPIVCGGLVTWMDEDAQPRSVRLVRAHLEEDAGKLVHDRFSEQTAVDLNRAGTPLLEVVTEPELHGATDAVACLRYLHDLVCTLGICDGNMFQGSFRCDVNVSLAPEGSKQLGVRTEMKNLNSFRFVERAIVGEIDRQRALLESGEKIEQQTRHYDARNDTSYAMRSKEEEMDYRYFPDPDLMVVLVDEKQIEQVRSTMPELPHARAARIGSDYDLSVQDVATVTENAMSTQFFEEAMRSCKDAKMLANWMRGDLAALLNRERLGIESSPVSAVSLATLINHIHGGAISSKMAKEVFAVLSDAKEDVDEIIARLDMRQQSDTDTLTQWVDEVLSSHPEQLAQYRAASEDKRKRLLGFFVGQVMKRSQGKADPRALNAILLPALESK